MNSKPQNPESLNPDVILARIEAINPSVIRSSRELELAFQELEKAFRLLITTGRLDYLRSLGRYLITEKGTSALSEVNTEINKQLCQAYKQKLETLRKAKRTVIGHEQKLKELRKKEAAGREAQKALMPGLFEEVEVQGVHMRLYLGETPSSKAQRESDELNQAQKSEKKELSGKDKKESDSEYLLQNHYDEFLAYETDLAKAKEEANQRAEREARVRAKAHKQAKKDEKKASKQSSEKSRSKKEKKAKKAPQAAPAIQTDQPKVNESTERQLIRENYKALRELIEARNGEIGRLVSKNDSERIRQFVRVDRAEKVDSRDRRPLKMNPGSTYEIGNSGMPVILEQALALVRAKTVQSLNIDPIVEAIQPFEDEETADTLKQAA